MPGDRRAQIEKNLVDGNDPGKVRHNINMLYIEILISILMSMDYILL